MINYANLKVDTIVKDEFKRVKKIYELSIRKDMTNSELLSMMIAEFTKEPFEFDESLKVVKMPKKE